MIRKLILLILFILGFLIADYSIAQDDKDDFRTKIEKIKIEKLVKKLDLDKSSEDIFIIKYKEFSRKIRELNKKRIGLVKQVEDNLDSGQGLDSLITEMLNVEQQITTARKDYAEDLKTILTAKQIATMVIFEKNFALELRKVLREYKKENRKK